MNYYFFCIQLINKYQKIVKKDFIYYNIIAIKWGELTHFPGRNDPDSITSVVHNTGIARIFQYLQYWYIYW
jgi:hypothetical protein